jgi:prophage DNA circulation protein
MGWRDNLRPASFRGVPFAVNTSSFSGGRRTAEHNFPDVDYPFFEDLGRAQRRFSVEAWIVGENYVSVRDRLISACERSGPGDLVHPYYGNRRVNAISLNVRETSTDGRMATITIEFVEVQEVQQPYPVAITEKAQKTKTAADTLRETTEEVFEEEFSVSGLPAFVRESATEILQGFSAAAGTAKRFLKDVDDTITQPKAFLEKAIVTLDNDAASIAAGAAGVITAVKDIVDFAVEASTVPAQIFSYFNDLFAFGADFPAVTVTTSTREQQEKNRQNLIYLTVNYALAEAARAAIETTYTSDDDAKADRTKIVDKLDEILQSTESDDIFRAIIALKSQVLQALPDEEQNLSKVVTTTYIDTLPTLWIAYDYYEDSTLEADIVARNRIVHPGFVAGGQEIKVLSNA